MFTKSFALFVAPGGVAQSQISFTFTSFSPYRADKDTFASKAGQTAVQQGPVRFVNPGCLEARER